MIEELRVKANSPEKRGGAPDRRPGLPRRHQEARREAKIREAKGMPGKADRGAAVKKIRKS